MSGFDPAAASCWDSAEGKHAHIGSSARYRTARACMRVNVRACPGVCVRSQLSFISVVVKFDVFRTEFCSALTCARARSACLTPETIHKHLYFSHFAVCVCVLLFACVRVLWVCTCASTPPSCIRTRQINEDGFIFFSRREEALNLLDSACFYRMDIK